MHYRLSSRPDCIRNPFYNRSVASTHLCKYPPTVILRVLASFISIYAKFARVLPAQMVSHLLLEQFRLESQTRKNPRMREGSCNLLLLLRMKNRCCVFCMRLKEKISMVGPMACNRVQVGSSFFPLLAS